MKSTKKSRGKGDWSISDAEKYYGFDGWGAGYFSVDEEGYVLVHPHRDARKIRLFDIVQEALRKGHNLPLSIRIQDLLRTRVIRLNELFAQAIEDQGYQGKYRGVFPIKVNQLREVVEEIQDAGEPYHYGLECGSKPELMIALAMHRDLESLIICNGSKDDEFIRLALSGSRLGKKVFLVVEQLSEVAQIIRISRQLNVKPLIGLRVKLSVVGEGKWACSSGEEAKFGLTSPEIVETASRLKEAGLDDCLKLIHFHIGSQVPNLQTIRKAIIEATRFYCELSRMGFPMELIDVGGGLGIDYDGSRSNNENSMNYTLRDYTRDVVFQIKKVCDASEVAVPDIVSESGRAVVASHSILVTEVCGRISKGLIKPCLAKSEKRHPVVAALESILVNVDRSSDLERFQNAQQRKEEANSLFQLDSLSLIEKAQADAIYWNICREIVESSGQVASIPEGLERLHQVMADQYICNFSVFQSLIDHWACDQLFPVSPLHRLNESPDVDATLVDITCDSEGKISKFVGSENMRSTIRLHKLKEKQSYYLGLFLGGAYQDIMGDLHNLFGRADEVHIFFEGDEGNDFYIEDSMKGFTVDDVLELTQYDGRHLFRMMKKQVDRAIKTNDIKPREGIQMLEEYTDLLNGKTYLST